jgi:hypothetical protein
MKHDTKYDKQNMMLSITFEGSKSIHYRAITVRKSGRNREGNERNKVKK